MRDAKRWAQIWSVSPLGGEPVQISDVEGGVTSALSVSADGLWIAHVAGGSVCATSIATGQTRRLTTPRGGDLAPLPEACVFAPTDHRIAFVRRVTCGTQTWNQICIVEASL
jgi:hypothetical protein